MKSLIAILAILASHTAVAADSCSSRIPDSLQAELAAAFPAFRVPAVKDNLPEDVQYDLAHGGNGCLGVAVADFDGNGTKDYALILSALQNGGWALVVALSHNGNGNSTNLPSLKRADQAFMSAPKKQEAMCAPERLMGNWSLESRLR